MSFPHIFWSIATAEAQTFAYYAPPQLEQLMAPIALYPDPLLIQALAACSYPDQVVAEEQWLRASALHGAPEDQVLAELEQAPWDSSVKSLVAFPNTLNLLTANRGWMQSVGGAYLTQQDDVMEAVQALRHYAIATGGLYPTPQTNVIQQDDNILIEPTNPYEVYEPSYNPATIYGRWMYPSYPPYIFERPVYREPSLAISLGTVDRFWGGHHWDWGRHEIIDERIGYTTDHQEHEQNHVSENSFYEVHRPTPVTRALRPVTAPPAVVIQPTHTEQHHEQPQHTAPAIQQPVVLTPHELPHSQAAKPENDHEHDQPHHDHEHDHDQQGQK